VPMFCTVVLSVIGSVSTGDVRADAKHEVN